MSTEQVRQPVHLGGCQCGAVRYAVYAEPTNPGVCHCRMCQRALGNPFHAFTGVSKSNFAWTKEPPGVFNSSTASERTFCRTCGTPLTFATIDGARITFGIATLDNPGAVEPPARSIGIESKLAWIDELSTFQGMTTLEDSGSDYVNSVNSNQRKQ